jgi:hypothetical protein
MDTVDQDVHDSQDLDDIEPEMDANAHTDGNEEHNQLVLASVRC